MTPGSSAAVPAAGFGASFSSSFTVPYLQRQRRLPYQPGATPQEQTAKHPQGLKARDINP
jgi:hypothetical protein